MADSVPNVCLNLSNRPENVLVVRQALTGLAENRGLDPIETNDMNTAVTEASNNVVQHAYEGDEGPLEVELYAQAGAVTVVVRDHGIGIRPHADEGEEAHAGIGLPVIHALTQSVEFRNLSGGGTEVRMQFAAANADALKPTSDGAVEVVAGSENKVSERTLELTMAPSVVAQAVLPRVLSALAARAHFSTDRISDIQLVADTLVASSADSISGSHLVVAVNVAPRNLELLIGPLRSGSASRLVESAAADGVGPVIDRLADDHSISTSSNSEVLALRLVEGR